MPDYSKALIYKLVCNDTYITENYIGSCCDYDERKRNHKSDCNNINGKKYNIYKYKFIRENGGFENWSMIIIKQFPCNSKRELEKEERVQLELNGGELNTNRPFTTDEEKKEYSKQYYLEHQEERNEYNKERIKKYHQKHKEKKKEQMKEYREANKEQLNLKAKQKHDCVCGGRYTNSGKCQHFKTKTHINFINNSKDICATNN